MAATDCALILERHGAGVALLGSHWHGDRCGCPDDRCIGHHHENLYDCSCLRAVLDGIVWDRLVGAALRSSSYLRQLNDAQTLASAAYYSALSADS